MQTIDTLVELRTLVVKPLIELVEALVYLIEFPFETLVHSAQPCVDLLEALVERRRSVYF